MLYAIVRSAVEVLRRGYTAEVLVDGLTEAQVASAVIFVGALAVFILRGRRARVSAGTSSAER
jgi:prolipoprotein diacylglyceryltransferase